MSLSASFAMRWDSSLGQARAFWGISNSVVSANSRGDAFMTAIVAAHSQTPQVESSALRRRRDARACRGGGQRRREVTAGPAGMATLAVGPPSTVTASVPLACTTRVATRSLADTYDLVVLSSEIPDADPLDIARYLQGLVYAQRKQFREQMVGAVAVVGLLVVFAVIATLLLTRRLVAPMRWKCWPSCWPAPDGCSKRCTISRRRRRCNRAIRCNSPPARTPIGSR